MAEVSLGAQRRNRPLVTNPFTGLEEESLVNGTRWLVPDDSVLPHFVPLCHSTDSYVGSGTEDAVPRFR